MTMPQGPYQGASPPQYPAGWYPDPQGRFEQRWFDGATWSPHVMRGGVASVDAAAAAMAVPSGGAGWPAAGASTAWRSDSPAYGRRVNRNKVGLGLVLGVVGLAIFAGSWVLPWVGGDGLFALRDATTSSGTAPTAILWNQVMITGFWVVIAVLGTTLPYQPGKFVGFCLGSLIGLAVCWRRVDAHDPTARVNATVAILSPIWMFSLWYRTRQVTNHAGPYFHASFGLGPWVALAGMLVVVIGAIVGRRHVLVTQ